MPKPRLSVIQKGSLRKASHKGTKKNFSSLSRYFKRQRWIGNNNRYGKNTIRRIQNDLDPNKRGALNQKHLAEYIAASVVLHCIDGWAFLGKSITAYMNGDRHASHHLAYYAELRAAMSLLAYEGIGVFSKQHFYINNIGSCQRIPGTNKGTHVFTWLALEHWANLKDSTQILMNIIIPAGIPLQDWLVGFGAGVTSLPIGNKWLRAWGLDLKHISQDHNGRNEVSYRPNFLNYRSPINALEASRLTCRIWDLFEPYEYSRFEMIDRYLLKNSLREAYTAITGNSPETNKADFENRIDILLNRINPPGIPNAKWRSFILSKDVNPFISEAFLSENILDVRHHLHVVARAALLLRVATGAAAILLREAGIDNPDLSFWWINYGNDLGLWDPPLTIEFIDLWADVGLALNDLSSWEIQNQRLSISYLKMNQDVAKEIDILSSCERIGLWGLGL